MGCEAAGGIYSFKERLAFLLLTNRNGQYLFYDQSFKLTPWFLPAAGSPSCPHCGQSIPCCLWTPGARGHVSYGRCLPVLDRPGPYRKPAGPPQCTRPPAEAWIRSSSDPGGCESEETSQIYSVLDLTQAPSKLFSVAPLGMKNNNCTVYNPVKGLCIKTLNMPSWFVLEFLSGRSANGWNSSSVNRPIAVGVGGRDNYWGDVFHCNTLRLTLLNTCCLHKELKQRITLRTLFTLNEKSCNVRVRRCAHRQDEQNVWCCFKGSERTFKALTCNR